MLSDLFIFGPLEQEFLISLVLALVCGLAIGVERELRDKPAGISTHATVIAGAMLFSFMSHVVGVNDPTRIAAQVVSGIGFLGAGIILKSESTHTVHNLTTAASIWYSASIGMALGFGFNFIAIMATVFVIFINRIPHVHEESGFKRFLRRFKS